MNVYLAADIERPNDDLSIEECVESIEICLGDKGILFYQNRHQQQQLAVNALESKVLIRPA